MLRAAACFHRHGAATKTVDETLHRTAPHPTPQNNPTRRVQTRQAAGVLAQIDPQNHDIHRSAPLPLANVSDHMRIAARGAGHPIIRFAPFWESPSESRSQRPGIRPFWIAPYD